MCSWVLTGLFWELFGLLWMLFVGFRELLAELASYRVIFGVVHVFWELFAFLQALSALSRLI